MILPSLLSSSISKNQINNSSESGQPCTSLLTGILSLVRYKYGLDFMSVNLQIEKDEYDNTKLKRTIRQGRGNTEATKGFLLANICS